MAKLIVVTRDGTEHETEGDGMRHNVMEHCDVLAKLPISPRMESLNISNAAAIALYAVATAGA